MQSQLIAKNLVSKDKYTKFNLRKSIILIEFNLNSCSLYLIKQQLLSHNVILSRLINKITPSMKIN